MTTTTTTTRKGTYQMLWDCPVCGTRKLLGVDHRHCPNCGAPQEENLRYFPSKADRVATEFRGTAPDWECEHCGTPNFSHPGPDGQGGGFCAGCGAPRGGSKAVHVRASISADASETGEQAAAEWKQRQAATRERQAAAHLPPPVPPTRAEKALAWLRAAGPRLLEWLRGSRQHPVRLFVVALGLALVTLLVLVACPRKVPVEVVGHTWTRVIPVERYTTLSETDWCSSMPGDAREHSRWSEIHHYDQVPDGEDCHTVPGSCSQSCSNVDNGNGSFSEVCTETCTSDRTECTTRYRDEPVYADKCSYEIDRWVVNRQAETRGDDLAPYWPGEPAFSGCARTAIGCERLGQRYGVYVVRFLGRDGEEVEHLDCERDEPEWRALGVGSRFIGEVSRLTGELDCDELEPDESQS